MTKTDEHLKGVMAVTSLARKVNSDIGDYKEHFLNENFGFTVRLSNGAINMSSEVAHDYETLPSSVTADRIQNVADTFRKM